MSNFTSKNIKSFLISNYSLILVLIGIISVFILRPIFINVNGGGGVLSYDTFGYYLYLPATFIYQDLANLSFVQELFDTYRPANAIYQVFDSPTGGKVLKYPIGLSILYLPFFLLAHLFTFITDYPSDGMSLPYHFGIVVGMSFYCFIGLIYLKKVIVKLLDNRIANITILLLFFATNLVVNLSVKAAMPHGVSFALYAVLIWVTIKWHEEYKFSQAVLIGGLVGFLTCIRPTNAISLLFPLLYGINNFESLKDKIVTVKTNYTHLVGLMVVGLIAVSPQLIYWKYATDSWIHYSYHGESFYFFKAQIANVLFSFRKGWLFYHPIWVLIFPGLYFLWKKLPKLFIAVLIFFVLNFWIVSSWHCWWYGGSYGQRALVDSYAIIALPFAAFIGFIFNGNQVKKYLFIGLFSCLIIMNWFQMWQYFEGILHQDQMTKEAYVEIIGKTTKPDNLEKLLLPKQMFNSFEERENKESRQVKELFIDSIHIQKDWEFIPHSKEKPLLLSEVIRDSLHLFFQVEELDIENANLELVLELKREDKIFQWTNYKVNRNGIHQINVPISLSYTHKDQAKLYFWNKNKQLFILKGFSMLN